MLAWAEMMTLWLLLLLLWNLPQEAQQAYACEAFMWFDARTNHNTYCNHNINMSDNGDDDNRGECYFTCDQKVSIVNTVLSGCGSGAANLFLPPHVSNSE